MHEKKGSKWKGILRFAEEKGFYIILSLCIVAIGVSGYVLFFTGGEDTIPVIDPITLKDDPQPEVPVIQHDPQPQQPTPVNQGDSDGEKAQASDAPVAPVVPDPQPKESASEPPPDSTPVSNPVNVALPTYVVPVAGDIIKGFSMDEPMFNETMGDWRVHNGVDIACEEGAPVYAMTEGVITGIDFEEMSGHFISVEHKNGLVSTYFGLNPNTTMKVNQEVSAGQQIGTVGNTMLAEIAQPCHLHLVVTRQGEYIDPMSLLQ